MQDTDLTVVARFRDPGAAQLARGYLEGSGIPCFVYDYQTVSIAWWWSDALGGVRLMVPRDRAAEARVLLQTEVEHAGLAVGAGARVAFLPGHGKSRGHVHRTQ